MKKTRWAALLVGLLAVGLVAGVAVAAEGEGSAEGTGRVWAKGEGTATLDGAGKVKMKIGGDVVIEDHAGDATVVIRSYPDADATELGAPETQPPASRYVLEGFRGVVKVRGSDFRIEAAGTMTFKGRGHGTVTVDGKGRWHTWRTCGTWGDGAVDFGGGDVTAN